MAKRITLDFLRTESASGMILAAAALVAIVLANSPWAGAYFGFIEAPFTIQVGGFVETHSILDWIKEGLMAIFFFVVGLEIKYEIVRGELANPRRLALPVVAALGGMIIPAAIYLAINAGPNGVPQGWPTPVATDIAFALAAPGDRRTAAFTDPSDLPPDPRHRRRPGSRGADRRAIHGQAAPGGAGRGAGDPGADGPARPLAQGALPLLRRGFPSALGLHAEVGESRPRWPASPPPRRSRSARASPAGRACWRTSWRASTPYVAFLILPLFAFAAAVSRSRAWARASSSARWRWASRQVFSSASSSASSAPRPW
jgi:hypothetical protein